jgi:hypothetical protein
MNDIVFHKDTLKLENTPINNKGMENRAIGEYHRVALSKSIITLSYSMTRW